MGRFDFWKKTQLDLVAIRINDRDKMIVFYRDVIGLDLKKEENELAIFGTLASDRELLWLEETPESKKANRKLALLTLTIPNVAEFHGAYSRIKNKKYPIIKKFAGSAGQAFFVADPEGNQLAIKTGSSNWKDLKEVETLPLGNKKSLDPLMPGAYFSEVRLNTGDPSKESAFLQEYLGWQAAAIDTEDLSISLQEGNVEEGKLGLDFLQFRLEPAELQQLMKHLQMKNADFFVNKKQTILTIFDRNDIEWWFVADPL